MPLYAFGSNGSGQLGIGRTDDLTKPEKCLIRHCDGAIGIKQVVAGGNHTLILYTDGHVEAFGSNEHHELGIAQGARTSASDYAIDGLRDRGHPTLVDGVAANWTASTCLDSSGAIATCGEGLSGELGQGKGISSSSVSSYVQDFPPQHRQVVQIASSMAHMVAVLDNGELWGWGKGRKGQLGPPLEDAWSPRRIEVGFPVVQAVCGKDFTFVAGTPTEGRVALLGVEGRDRFNLKSSVPHTALGWRDIAASWGSVFILFDGGRLVGYGRNDHGQLPPAGLPLIEQVAAGSEHCIALTTDGKVLAWGWGEHGNCGEHTDSNGDVKGGWNEIEIEGQAIGVFAGCATSFVATADQDTDD